MFPRRYFPGRYFAPRYFPQSQGVTPSNPDVDYYRRYLNDVETRDSMVAIGLPVAAVQTRFSGYVNEDGSFRGYLLEDGSGVLLMENDLEQDYLRRYLNDTLFRD